MSERSYDMARERLSCGSVECRACAVVCEKVVYPSHCLRTSCRSVYAFREGDVTFFGCLHKVFRAEIDLAPHLARPRADVYGAWKVRGEPLPHCRVEVVAAYPVQYSFRGCANPLFRQEPADYSPEAVRRIVDGLDRPQR